MQQAGVHHHVRNKGCNNGSTPKACSEHDPLRHVRGVCEGVVMYLLAQERRHSGM